MKSSKSKNSMYRNTRNFLFSSACFLIILCIIVFSVVGAYMKKNSDDTIDDIGTIYMSEMSTQLREKFNAVVELRFLQLEGLIQRTPPETDRTRQELMEELAYGANIRGFSFLGLYTADGENEILLGTDISPSDETEFSRAIQDNGNKVTSGVDQNGERVLLLVNDVQYPMKDDQKSKVLVAGIPMSYMQETLGMDSDNSMIYYHIIRRDGSFVIRSGAAYRENYFSRILEVFSELDGKTPENYVDELRIAMETNSNYSSRVLSEGSLQQMYCSALAGTEWYLVAVMPYSILSDAVTSLANTRQTTMLTACGIILLGVLIIFIIYYHLSQRQLKELERAEQEAVHANLAKSEFLSNMSHDIRTPMNGIMGMTGIAMTCIDDKERLKDCLSKIALSGKHLLGLVNDVLDMSKIESGKLSLNIDKLSLRETMESLVNIVQPQIKAKHQHFDIFIRKIESEDVFCDNVRLNQILINLLSNAVKYTPEGGRVNIYLEQEPSPLGSHYVRCHFGVKDNGIGMTPEFQKTIFDSFTREKNTQVEKTEGAGLGMAITKCIVDVMKGSIEVTSEPGKGSEFHVVLDLEKADIREEDMVLPSWKALMVDNNEELCLSALQALKEIGLDAEYALGGEEAVRMVEKRHAAHDDYQVVILDWKMPGMDGLQATREIRKLLGEETPILIISAYDWSDIKDEALKVGASGFISKPLFKSNLYLGLSRYILDEADEKQQRREPQTEDFTGMRILLAEDNEINWEIAEAILTSAGFQVDHAENGKICVETFVASEVGHYDIVLMDIRMPVMSGYDAAKGIRASGRPDANLPIFAMTADAFSEDIQHCMECGMNEHVSKPIDMEKLLRLLTKYLKN